MHKQMKAAVFRGPKHIEVVHLPVPPCPEDGVLVRVHACGICGSDIRNYEAGLKDGITDQIMGHEIAGEIVEAAPSTRFQLGDRVALAPDVSCGSCWYCKRGMVNLCQQHKMLGTHFPGGFAQYLALPGTVLAHGFMESIPQGMCYTHAAFAETAAAVVACQARCQISLGDTVVIVGDGPVGCLHVEIARARGAGKIILLGLDRLKLAEEFSPDVVLDNRNGADCVARVLELTQGRGADVVISCVPTAQVQQQGLEMLRKRGVLIIYGGVPKASPFTTLDSNRIHYNELTVTGAFSYPATGLQDALSAIHRGEIQADKYIGESMPLEQLVESMEWVKQGKVLKAMIDPWK